MFARVCAFFITLYILDVWSGAVPSKNQAELPIKYPGPVKETHHENLTNRFQVPEGCEGKSYCTVKPDDYPQETFNKILKGKNQIAVAQVIPEPDVGNRQGDPEELDDCESEIDYEPIYTIKDKGGDWRTVIQSLEENYVQRVRIEQCKDTKSRCFTPFPNMNYIQTYCKQEYTTWELVVATAADKSKTEKIRVELPTCCSCVYKFVNLASRSGFKKP